MNTCRKNDGTEVNMMFSINGNLEYLIDNIGEEPLLNSTFIKTTIKYASMFGHINILEYLRQRATPEDINAGLFEHVYKHAIKYERINVLEWFDEHQLPGININEALDECAIHGYLDLARWLCDKYPEHLNVMTTRDVVARAIRYRHDDVAKFLLGKRPQLAGNGTITAVNTGNIELAEWILTNYGPLPEPTGLSRAFYDNTTQGGHLDALKWCRERNLGKPTAYAITSAILNGHMDVVLWLRQEFPRLKFEKNALKRAACAGNLDAVKWLVEESGQEFDRGAVYGRLPHALSHHIREYLSTTL